VPGDIYHVDTIFYESEVLFSIASRYGRPPMDVSQQGDIFTTSTLGLDSKEAQPLIEMNRKVMKAFGMVRGVSTANSSAAATTANCTSWRPRHAWAERTLST